MDLDLAKSILFATNITGRVRSKSISVRAIIICSAFWNETLSTTE